MAKEETTEQAKPAKEESQVYNCRICANGNRIVHSREAERCICDAGCLQRVLQLLHKLTKLTPATA